MPTHKFIVNGSPVEVECEPDVRVLWVLRDLLGITGPKYGCGLSICQSCTSHINGKVFNPCAVPVGDLRPGDEITTIEGLAATFEGSDLHPVQQVWIDEDVAQCGFCQPGQIMAAVGLIEDALAEKRDITDADLDALRNVCRCGTYPRVRTAIHKAADVMAAQPREQNARGAAPDLSAEAAGTAGAGQARSRGRVAATSAGSPQLFDLGADAGLARDTGRSLLGPAAAAAGTAVAVRTARRRLDAGDGHGDWPDQDSDSPDT